MINEKVKNNNVTDIIKTPKKSIIPRSEKQKGYVRALRQSDIIISAGPAGTGKTFLAVAVGLTMLLDKKIERIILSRPAVEAGERLGFLPGDMKDKVDPYLRPLYDALYDLFGFEKIQKKIDHWQKIANHACEQSGRSVIVNVSQPASLDDLLNEPGHNGFVLHHRATLDLNQVKETLRATILIGPEGGLSEKEVTTAENAGYKSLLLGKRILRKSFKKS